MERACERSRRISPADRQVCEILRGLRMTIGPSRTPPRWQRRYSGIACAEPVCRPLACSRLYCSELVWSGFQAQLFQVEVALHPPPDLVADLAVAAQLQDRLALGV